MLLTYVGILSVALLILGIFVYDQNITTNVLVNQETRSTCRLKEGFMIDCLPHMDDAIINATTCESMSCCFKSINNNREAPVCYRRLPSYRGFKISSEDIFPTEENIQDIENPPVLSKLTVNVKSLAPGHVLVAICDTSEEPGRCEKTSKNDNTKESGLNVQLLSKNKKFQIVVSRNGTVKTNLFDSSHGAIIIGQKMSEISTILSSPYIFGLGGHPASFSTNKTSNFTIKSLFSSNLIENPQRTSIKSFLGVDDNKNFYGLLLESKTPVEVELLPGIPNKKPFLIFRSMGGIITFHIFAGPKPSDVSEQIANVIGKPKLPPKWILGIHLCRSNGELMKSEAIETNFPYDSDCLDRGVVGSGFKLMYSPEEIAKISILLRIKNKKIIITNPLPIDPKEKVNKKLKLINDQRNKIELIGDYKQFKNVSIPDLLEDTKEWKNALTFFAR
ncbi:lysosomal alpha-glucosidase isoform X2 [Lepeophtheirus salmonis]|nr:probable maltase-glucoamylase 2 isoform X2 [Lepeophtheirus salmonis]